MNVDAFVYFDMLFGWWCEKSTKLKGQVLVDHILGIYRFQKLWNFLTGLSRRSVFHVVSYV